MNYSIEFLEKEKEIFEYCLKKLDQKTYLESTKVINQNIESIKTVIESTNDLRKLAEIERDFSTFGTLTFEQEKEKTEILKKYEL